MKNRIIVVITCALIVLVILLINTLLFNLVWYYEYAEYDHLRQEDIKVLSDFDRETFLAENTNFNSVDFSSYELYQNITNGMKKKYPTVEEFEKYCSNKILDKLDGKQYYSLIKYISEESSNGVLKVKYSIYMFDLETYIEVLSSDEFDSDKAKFSLDVFLVEEGIDNYKIEF